MFNFEFNYGQTIFKQLLNTNIIKNKLTDILQILFANLLQIQTCTIFSYFFLTNSPIDYFVPIILSTTLSINIHIFYNLIEPFRPQIYWLSRYLIKHYSIENYFLWKKIIVSVITIYSIIYLYLIPVNNQMIIIYLGQSLISFLIIDLYEQRSFHRFWEYYYLRPKIIFHSNIPTNSLLINSYLPNPPPSNLNDTPKVIWHTNNIPNFNTKNKSVNSYDIDNSFILIKNKSCLF